MTDENPPTTSRRTKPNAANLAALREPFQTEEIGKLPRSTCKDCSDNRGTCQRHPNKFRCAICGNYHSDSSMHIDYVGHADVTARLLAVDPEWTWRPFSVEEIGALPPVLRDAGLWIHLTVLGVTRPGFGDADGKRGGNAVKEAIGDALRNAAMRLGVALDLWAKGDREWAVAAKTGAEAEGIDPPPPSQPQSDPRGGAAEPAPWNGPTAQELIDLISGHAISVGKTLDEVTEQFRTQHNLAGVTEIVLLTVPPSVLSDLEGKISKRVAELNAAAPAADPWATPESEKPL